MPTTSNGILIIINNLLHAFLRNGYQCDVITTLNGIPKDANIIPYALEPAVEMIRKGYKTETAFMTDAYTLGHLNKIKFYLKRGSIFQYDFPRSIYCYFQEGLLEKEVVNNFKKIILVSQIDIDYLNEKYSTKPQYICVPNGANFEEIEQKTKSDVLRLGILLSWGHKVMSFENGWLIKDYFKRFHKRHPQSKLMLAGRGAYIHDFEDIEGVEIRGEVGSLNDFFKDIDVFLVANPKGCGILNRILDAFVFKTCVLGVKGAFTGFSYMSNSYMEFNSYKEFEDNLEELYNNKRKVSELTENAYNNICQYNNWEINYDKLIYQIEAL